MADIDTSSAGKKNVGVKKAKKANPRVDLTPMVDLGFLLITFFIFTTTMSQPTAMRLFLPQDTKNTDQQTKAKESGALTILLGKNNTVYYYEGILSGNASNFKSSNFGSGDDGIRSVILKKKMSTPESDLVIVIKPSDECDYKNVVDILDEMSVNVIKRYALVDISPVEAQLVQKTEAAAGIR